MWRTHCGQQRRSAGLPVDSEMIAIFEQLVEAIVLEFVNVPKT
jgi:hypothetical protein